MNRSADEIKIAAQALFLQLRQDRRYLHRCPEIGTELPRTAGYIRQRLENMGIPWQNCGGALPKKMTEDYITAGFPRMERATGITAVIGSGSPCILLRADMDALPVREDNALSFRADGNASHMCGHDSHAAMLLGAAKLLKDREKDLKGTVKLMFQPGEETGAGARLMVDAGVLKNPEPQAAFAIHVQPAETVGTACYSIGVNSASLDTFILKIQGKGGHSSQPHLCVDPVMIMNQVYQAVNLLVTREADPAAAVALTCGVTRAGTAVNIIPDHAELHIGLRTLNPDAAAHLTERIPQLIDHYVKAWGGEYKLTTFHTPCTYTDKELCSMLLPGIEQITGEDRIRQISPMTATEDFGYVTEQVPGMFLFLGAGKPGNAPLHSPQMVLDEDVLPTGAAIYANAAIQWLEEEAGKVQLRNVKR